ncbi:MAG TPA: cytochrome c biogenesis protein CcsA [Candidatus Polarisedimenticolia bacterium]|nr:cytochrome c biogenesis protein CcsA [Candidatus Polarisedimenticolia bacterium]
MRIRIAGTALLAALIVYAGYAALYIAPDERTMHEVQRIFYFHVPSWITSFTAFSVVFLANIAYLLTRRHRWDCLGVAAAEVGVACCTIGLITGPLWARPVWGIWWTWDARLTTTFILWLLYISYLLLRGLLEDPQRRAALSAVFGIFAFLDVPLVYLSNRLWRTQHPQPVILGGQGSGLDPTMAKVLLLCVIAIFGVMIPILLDRYRIELVRHELDGLRQKVELRSAGSQSPALRS